MTTPDAATLAGNIMPQNGSTQEPNGGPTEKPAQRVKQSEVVEGGSPSLEIWLDPATQQLVKERLINRLQTVNAISSKERPLRAVERIIQRLGPEAIARLEKGDLTREDLAIAVFVLRDELLQKSLAAGKTIKDIKTTETTRLGKIPFFRRIVQNSSLKTQLDASKSQSTEYTGEIGFDQWTTDHIENDLVALNQLRTSVELSFYERHIDDPLFDQDSISLYTAGRKTGNRLHDAVVDELMGAEGVLTNRYGGKTFLELWNDDPTAALTALNEANQRALTTFADGIAKELLTKEKPTANTDLIEKQAKKLEEGPKPEEIDPLTNEAIKTNQTKLDAFNKELADVEKEIRELETGEDYSKKELELEASNRLSSLEARKNDILKNQLLTKAELDSLRLTLNKTLEGGTGAEERLKRQEKAKALRKWNEVVTGEVVTGYDKIIDARFSQKYGDEYTRERLADIEKTADGQIKGAERIREHIFRLVNEGDYDPILARKMLSDQTLTKAIVWVYKIDSSIVSNDDGTLSLEKTLPYLRSSQFQVGDLLRFVVHEGVKSAETGNPYLALDRRFEAPKPELKLEAESIYKEGVGRIIEQKDIKDPVGNNGYEITWEGVVTNVSSLNPDIPLTLRVTPKAYRSQVYYGVQVRTNQRFFESLPRSIPTAPAHPFPGELLQFYDSDGNLKTDIKNLPNWVKLKEIDALSPTSLPIVDDALGNIDSEIAPSISEMIKSAVADFVLQKAPQDRLKMLKGFVSPGITNIARAEDGALQNYQMDLDDNGSLFITNITDSSSPQELQEFFRRRLDVYRKSKGVQTLNLTEREDLQKEFMQILSRIGLAVLQAQQSR